MVKVIITGACGFIGHHIAEYIHKNTDWNIVIFDKLTYASMGLDRLRNNQLLYSHRVKVYTIDICNEISEGIKSRQCKVGASARSYSHMFTNT